MSFLEWEQMPSEERRHRKLLWLAEIESAEEERDEADRQRWLDEAQREMEEMRKANGAP